ncbi:hypothetical protein [Actinocorallia lasiicapitis]
MAYKIPEPGQPGPDQETVTLVGGPAEYDGKPCNVKLGAKELELPGDGESPVIYVREGISSVFNCQSS